MFAEFVGGGMKYSNDAEGKRNYMNRLKGLEPQRVFEYFEEISAVPRGSGHTAKIADFCVRFAEKLKLQYVRDAADNVIIFKAGTLGYEKSKPIILQGHLDMVWQKDSDCDIDFEREGLRLVFDEKYVAAKGTTLGADNGIAVAMIMAILESDSIAHPPIEAVFTSDEEVGMIGANQLDTELLCGRRMINIDSENPEVLTVSCAGGSDFIMTLPAVRRAVTGQKICLSLHGLQGGHSGIEIDKGRVNANVLALRVLNHMQTFTNIQLISISGGTKPNAIPRTCIAEFVVEDAESILPHIQEYLHEIKTEIAEREPEFAYSVKSEAKAGYSAVSAQDTEKIISALLLAPNGVQEMSASINGLVETSLNMGILATEEKEIRVHFALRSNKASALRALEEKLFAFAKWMDCRAETGGYYAPWEFKKDSDMQKLYIDAYREICGSEPSVEAIHAGLECAVFSGSIQGLDCISVGPGILDAHTTNERLDIASVQKIYSLVLRCLEKCK